MDFSIYGLPWKSHDLVILNLHSTPRKFHKNFGRLLLFLDYYFNIISPSDLENFNPEKINQGKPSLLLTFDDGLKNNLFTATFLSRKGIKALFFVVPNFINESIELRGSQYYVKNIRPKINLDIDGAKEDVISMTWEDLKELLNMGHEIGSHTMSHLLDKTMTQKDLQTEIVASKTIIENKLRCKISHFCSPNNSALSVSEHANNLIKNNYKYHYTTYHGANNLRAIPFDLKRINIETFWNLNVIKFAMGSFQNKRLN